MMILKKGGSKEKNKKNKNKRSKTSLSQCLIPFPTWWIEVSFENVCAHGQIHKKGCKPRLGQRQELGKGPLFPTKFHPIYPTRAWRDEATATTTTIIITITITTTTTITITITTTTIP
ncbi:hypothetical protein M0804_000212 [Polistes exclamans]|nr:hypothetical protein M0804_000212 [Polistes exclamans]